MAGEANIDGLAWAGRLRHAAMTRLAGSAWEANPGEGAIEGFRDDAGHHRRVDRAFLRWRCGLAAPRAVGEVGEVALWWDVLEAKGPIPPGDAALFPEEHERAIEVWTEMELCGLHALAWRARQADGRGWREGAAWRRCLGAMRWLMEDVQPDNATQHPWALHLFAWSSTREELGAPWRGAARVYAEMMLHGAMLPGGRPELFSALVLLDGAAWLEHA